MDTSELRALAARLVTVPVDALEAAGLCEQAADEIDRLRTRVAYADSDLEERQFWESRYVEVREQLARAVEVLRWYADTENYDECKYFPAIETDNGQRARDVLKELSLAADAPVLKSETE